MPWTAFAALTNATGQELDDNFFAAFSGASFLGTIAGTNALTLAVTANAPPIPALVNGMTFYGIAANTNAAAVTLAVGAFSPLAVYKDTSAGPSALTGNEIIQKAATWFTYDSTLNVGAGGFHLRTGGAILVGQTITINGLILGGSSILKRVLSQQSTVTFSNLAANATQDVTVTFAGILAGDAIIATPPASIAAGVTYAAYVPASGSICVRAANVTAASLTPTGGVFRLTGVGFA